MATEEQAMVIRQDDLIAAMRTRIADMVYELSLKEAAITMLRRENAELRAMVDSVSDAPPGISVTD